ncbi:MULTISPECIES: GNAT family N-acetyltransferase [Bacillus amyloliquefaciens group]|uniref:GNAT family N-acetyltransferase n=1 Tax=Bacillus amyloliquefaciens group TaxID=1938374 RepID=UPI000B51DF09|nr:MULTISPECIES: GNAT family N-acetyltransferase [Bacillus amyloliquefaciens group]ASF28525.1 hypothetical protein WV34_07035 [Bacillus amyloliquefaciens]MDQ8094761.1 GNAT family N-acetyltransferase [Bacillus amyloliquefaciens]
MMKHKSSGTILTTGRIRLRTMRDDDEENLYGLFTDKEVMKYYPSLKSRRETKEWIAWNKRLAKGYGVSLWIAEDKETGAFLGQCGIVPQTVNGTAMMEIGYMFARRHWGCGYATEAAKACLTYGFQTKQYGRIAALIDPENLASVRVAEKIGMAAGETVNKWERQLTVFDITSDIERFSEM